MRLIWGGRASVRAALYMGALVATRYNPLIQRFYYRLVAAGKPKKLVLWNRIHRHYLAALLYSCFAGRSAGGRRRRLFSRQRKHL